MDHDMHGTTTHDMGMATETSGMSMASSTSSMSHDGMSHGDMDMPMSMADMIMVFFTSSGTPLYSEAWTPSSKGEYAGTCIFLIALACILRVLLALKPILEARFWRSRTEHDVDGDRLLSTDREALSKLASADRLRQAGKDVGNRWSGWRASSALARATYEVVVVGIGYLLYVLRPIYRDCHAKERSS